MRVGADGRGVVSCLELPAVQDRPALFDRADVAVAELFEQLPEAGDLAKPKLVFFLDEAHLLFAGATDAFVESVARTVRLIRSKGVGVFFVTQAPTDLPEAVLGQLGSRVQHALRAFTPKDAKDLRAVVSTYPTSEFYDVGELLTSMGTGEAAVTLLSEKGVPTPVVHTRMLAPASKMAPIGRRRGRRQGVAAVREVRHAGGRAERARDPRRAARGGRARPEPAPAKAPPPRTSRAEARAGAEAPPRTGSATSSAPARARRSRSRSCAASSGCCASGSSSRGC